MSIWAIVPFKGVRDAKKRLAGDLTAIARERLVRAMLDDVLGALLESRMLTGTLLVSKAEEANSIAQIWSGVTLYRESSQTLVGALIEAGEILKHRMKATTTVIVPGDVPLITGVDLDELLQLDAEAVIVPDAWEIGTNALVSSPPNAFPILFDGRSFQPHVAAAELAFLHTHVMQSPNFAVDVDTTEDLKYVLASDRDTRTKRLLQTDPAFAALLDERSPA